MTLLIVGRFAALEVRHAQKRLTIIGLGASRNAPRLSAQSLSARNAMCREGNQRTGKKREGDKLGCNCHPRLILLMCEDGAFSILAPNDKSQLPRLNDGVECRTFRRFGRGACPETPHGFLWQASPELPQSNRLAPSEQPISPLQYDAPLPISRREDVTSRATSELRGYDSPCGVRV
jgi:hypothetical protein